MLEPGDEASRRRARADLIEVAAEFATASRTIVEAMLRRHLDELLLLRAEWYDGLPPEVGAAFAKATGQAIDESAAEVAQQLREEDRCLSPKIVPGGMGGADHGWPDGVPEWLLEFLRRWSPRSDAAEVGPLDDTGNRVWLVFLSAPKALDPVLEEFGLTPSEVPDPGGGNYGLHPRSAADLDPGGTLAGLRARYLDAYRRYARPSRRRA